MKASPLVTFVVQPAVVDVDVGVADVLVALGHHEVGHLPKQPLAYAVVVVVRAVGVASKALPRQPPHGRRSSQPVFEAPSEADDE